MRAVARRARSGERRVESGAVGECESGEWSGGAGGLEGGADGPEDEGEPDQGDVFGQAGSDVDFDQAVGDEDVGHGGDEAGVAA